jgi:hypothetical protein
VLTNNLRMVRGMNRQYEDRFAQEGRKAGDTINIRKPPRYKGRRGEQVQVEGSTETYVPLALNPLYGCDIQFSTTDLTLSIDDFSRRFIVPQVATVVNMIDFDACQLYKTVHNYRGIVGAGSGVGNYTSASVLSCGVTLNEEATPQDGQRNLVISPLAEATFVENFKSLFNPVNTIASQFKGGAMGTALNFNFAMDQNIAVHTSGTATGSGTTSAAVANGATSVALTGLGIGSGAATCTLKKGDILEFTGVYAVNPQSRQRNSYLRTCVVTDESVTLTGGAGTVNVSPALYYTGQFQNCDVQIASSTAVTVRSNASTAGVSTQNMAFHPDAFTFASVPLELPGGVDMAARQEHEGVSVRLVRQYDINSNNLVTRLDILAGFATVYPELAVRLQN